MGEAQVTKELVSKLMDDSFWDATSNLVLAPDSSAKEKLELEKWLECSGEFRGHVFFQTSGSTGSPKWVALSKEALLESARAVNYHLGVNNGYKFLLVIPLHHVGGFGVTARAYLGRGEVEVFEGKWDVKVFTKRVSDAGSQYISLVPTQIVDLVRTRCVAPDCVEAVIVGGGHLNDAIYRGAKSLGWPVLRSYGMSEAGSQIATGDEGDYWLKVLDGWELSLDDRGRLRFRGDAAFSAYVLKKGDEFVVEKPFDSEGWFTTEDEVLLNNGRLKFVRRRGRTIKILGELVDLDNVEKRLGESLGCDTVIVPQADERRGANLIAIVDVNVELPDEWKHGLTAISELFKIEALPRSPLGKIRRSVVEEWVKARFTGDKTAE